MSIFKDSFHPSVRQQLNRRQIAINDRTSQNLTYFNSRNAWIRLSSSVNTYKKNAPNPATIEALKDPANYDNTLAKQYVLQGGILYNGAPRAGIGDFSNAYSNVGTEGEAYRLGIRPMPGITGVDIKNKGAYGSLRQATITFQCWDIKQLEDLELLYMRPGYSALLEWGWLPYLNNNGSLTNTLDYTDIIDTQWEKEELFKRQYARATNGIYRNAEGKKVEIIGYEGNCDSMFGMIKNYSWKARMDGGYDCTTEIISMGEVIESLKVNYSPMDNIKEYTTKGLVLPNLSPKKDGTRFGITEYMDLSGSYSQNVMAGIFTEMWGVGTQIKGGNENEGIAYVLYDSKYKCYYDMFRKVINIKGGDKDATGTNKIGQSDEQIYISLESLVNLFNNYILLRDKKSGKPYAPLSVLEKDATTPNPITGEGYLLALAHPLEISVDPTVCLIKSPLWTKGIQISALTGSINGVDPNSGLPAVGPYGKSANGTKIYNDAWWRKTAELVVEANKERTNGVATKTLQSYVSGYVSGDIEEVKEIQREFYNTVRRTTIGNIKIKGNKTLKEYSSFYDLLDEGIGSTFANSEEVEIGIALGIKESDSEYDNIINASKENPITTAAAQLEQIKEQVDEQNKSIADSVENIKFLNILPRPYFINNEWKLELGIIGNIFVNLNMLYNLSVDSSLAAQDKKEKNDIAVYDFIKNVLSKISSAIGEVNNFDIFVDPDTNVARIIDVNYVDRKEAGKAYEEAFELQVHNLNSVVRSYSLESKIFQEQTSIVAIGAQVGGGALGVDTSTLVDFNKAILDRIIPIKDAPTAPEIEPSNQQKLNTLIDSLSILSTYFNKLSHGFFSQDSDFRQDEVDNYKNALKDIITFFKALGTSKTKNKAILPTVLSVNMDGIGGIIIGNLFKINADVLPKGYKNDINGIGSKLGYIVTGIGHSIKDSDWETKLEAQTIVLDEPRGMVIPFSAFVLDDGSVGVGTGVNNAGEVVAQAPASSLAALGEVALTPNISSIKDNEIDIIPGNYSGNNGARVTLAVVDGKPVGRDIAKAVILMKKAAAKDGVTLNINSGFRSPYDSINTSSSKGTPVNAQSQDSLYKKYLSGKGDLAAEPGKSNHGNAFAFDLNTGGNKNGAVPINNSVYKWLINNAYKYGFVRGVEKEEWHWEYRPGTRQYERVSKDHPTWHGLAK